MSNNSIHQNDAGQIRTGQRFGQRFTPGGWKRTPFRALVLRAQRSSLIKPRWRRMMLNAIGANIHPTATVSHNCWLGSASITMGKHAYLNAFAFYDGDMPLTIEHGARVAKGATFITGSHEITDYRWRRSSVDEAIHGEIQIRAGAWLGANCTVLPGVTIATGCVVGAGSTVTKSTEPDGLYLNAAGTSGAIYAQLIRHLPTRPLGL